jgi:hypothetical protein
MARLAASSAFAPGVRRAFVGVSDTQYSVAWTYARLSEPHDQLVHVFRDISVAEAWLQQAPRAADSRHELRSPRKNHRADVDRGDASPA